MGLHFPTLETLHGQKMSAHQHSHTHDGETYSHSHAHADAEHSHLHEHVEEEPVEEDVGPAQRYVTAADATDFEASATEIRYTGTSGLKVTSLDGLPKRLTHLTLRSCLVADIAAIAANGATLVHLELYDNQVKSLRGVEACPHLLVLDMSYNVIRSTAPVAVCSKLRELYVAANKLRTVEGLAALDELTKIDLGANRIRDVDGCLPPNLSHVYLGKNKIDNLKGLTALSKLKVLDVQSNRLTSLDGAFGPAHSNLVELYVAHNRVGLDLAPEHLSHLAALNTLDMSHNAITNFEPFVNLASLEDLWLSYNAVPSLEALDTIRHLSLTCIYLEHNPCARDPRYVDFIRDLFPMLTQLDALCYPPRH